MPPPAATRLAAPVRRLAAQTTTRACASATATRTPPPRRDDDDDDLDTLYSAVLSQVPAHGFTPRAIASAVEDLRWSPAAARMFPRGPADVVHRLIASGNRSLASVLADAHAQSDPVQRAAFAIRTRLQMNHDFHSHWSSALALHHTPGNVAHAARESALLADEIAHFAGYSHPDVSWYTDRAVIGATFHATQLYWITDKTPEKDDTWAFLDRRLRGAHATRQRASDTYTGFMNLSDAAASTLSTIIRSTRRSY